VSGKPLDVAIVGAGGLTRAMARALSRSGSATVVIASRKQAQARAAARGLSRVKAVRHVDEALAAASVVLLAVPDRSVEGVARAIVPLRASWRGVVVPHAAGAYGPELLRPLGRRGAATGVLHPLAVLGADGSGVLRGSFARIEGTPRARAAARKLCALTGLVPLPGKGLQTPAGRKSYHAAASLASNDLVALLAAAHGLLARRGVPPRAALAAVAHLAAGAVAAVRSAGLSGALTGPVARNDAATLAAQLTALATEDPAAERAHRALSSRLVELAHAAGRLDREAVLSLSRLLARGPGRASTV